MGMYEQVEELIEVHEIKLYNGKPCNFSLTDDAVVCIKAHTFDYTITAHQIRVDCGDAGDSFTDTIDEFCASRTGWSQGWRDFVRAVSELLVGKVELPVTKKQPVIDRAELLKSTVELLGGSVDPEAPWHDGIDTLIRLSADLHTRCNTPESFIPESQHKEALQGLMDDVKAAEKAYEDEKKKYEDVCSAYSQQGAVLAERTRRLAVYQAAFEEQFQKNQAGS